MNPEIGAFRPVPKIASTISVQSLDLGEVQLPRLAVGDLDDGQAEAAEDLEVDAGVAADLGDAADQEHRDVDAALHQRPRHDEAVAAVVAAAAQHRDLPLEQIAVDRFHRRDRLPAGVFHQHERRDADVVDRAAIGLAHLGGVQYSHEGISAGRVDTKDTKDTKDITLRFCLCVHRVLCVGSALTLDVRSPHGSYGERQRPRVRSGARRHLDLRPRLSLRRRRVRNAAHLQRPAVPVRSPHAPAAQVGRACSRSRFR